MNAVNDMTVIALGVHVLDTLVRPVEAIPEGDGGPARRADRHDRRGHGRWHRAGAGQAGRPGAQRRRDRQGRARRRAARAARLATASTPRCCCAALTHPTSASVLPIRPDGSRPAFHLIGANGTYGPDDAPWDAIAAATHLHLGGPEFMGGEAAAKVLSFAREHSVTTSLDSLAPGDPDMLEWIAAALPHVDYLLPNDDSGARLDR